MSEMDSGMWDRDYPTEEESLEMENSHADIYEKDEVYETEDGFFEDLEDEYEEEDVKKTLVDSARVRLEQGRLYNMLIEHDLFDGVEALPEAIDNVQKEMKDFIMERLEILLGMRLEKEPVQQVTYDSQFNELEVQVLRRLASKFSKGMTDTAPSEKETKPSQLNAVKKMPQQNSLNSLSANTQKAKPAVKRSVPRKTPQVLPTSKKRIKKELTEKNNSGLSEEEIAKKDIKYIESLKKMSLEQASEVVAQKYSRPKPKIEINQDAVNAHYQTRMAMNETANTFTKLLAAAKNK